jgi:hypothetical protein
MTAAWSRQCDSGLHSFLSGGKLKSLQWLADDFALAAQPEAEWCRQAAPLALAAYAVGRVSCVVPNKSRHRSPV